MTRPHDTRGKPVAPLHIRVYMVESLPHDIFAAGILHALHLQAEVYDDKLLML